MRAVTHGGMNWTVAFRLWIVGAVLWAAIIGLLLRNNGEEELLVIALGPPLVMLAMAARIWAVRVLRS